MADQGLASLLAIPGHEVDDALGDADLERQLSEQRYRQRRLLGRLDHDRAAGGQGGGELLDHGQQRQIPRGDGPDDADRLPGRGGVGGNGGGGGGREGGGGGRRISAA